MAKIFMAVVAGMFAFSCVTDTTEDLGIKVEGQGVTELALSLEESRTHLGEKAEGVYPLYWSEGDAIAVNGTISNPLAAGGEATAVFKFNEEVTAPLCVVYPAPEAVAIEDEVTEEPTPEPTPTPEPELPQDTYPVTFAHVQPYTVGTFAPQTAPMYGYAAELPETGVQLQHLTGVLRFAIKGNGEKVTSIVVKAHRGKIAGTFLINCKTGTLTAHEEAVNTVTVTFAEPLVLGAEAAPVYVAVPAGSHGTFLVTINTEAHEKMTVKFDSDLKPINAGSVREFKEFAYAANTADTEDSAFIIDSEEALIEFARIASTFYPRTAAKVVADLDMSEYNWKPIEGFGAYEFDGGSEEGYTIKGLSAPLFGTTAATIKNVTLTNVAIVETEAAFSGSIARILNGGELHNCSAAGTLLVNNTTLSIAKPKDDYSDIAHGGLVGSAISATIYNCESNVDVTVTSFGANNTAKAEAGGAIGTVTNLCKIKNVTNNGDVIYNGTTNQGGMYLCGVVGKANSTTTIAALAEFSNITNNGNISTHKDSKVTADLLFAGVAGDVVMENATVVCDKLTNNGDITHNGYSNGTRLAGVAAYNSTGSFTNCKNTGNLTIATGARHTAGYMGGVFGATVYPKTMNNIVNEGAITIQDAAKEDLTFKHGYVQMYGIAYGVSMRAGDDIPTVTNCTNRGPLSVGKITNATTGNGGRLYMAGLFSNIYAGNFSDCTNEATGTITAKTGLWSTEYMIGGFVTYIGSNSNCTTIKITDCENKAAILCDPYIDDNNTILKGEIGGFCGEAYVDTNADTYHVEFLRAKNSGNVTVKGKFVTSGYPYFGGFMGAANYDSLFFTDCEVSGTTDMNATAISACVGGFIGYDTTNWELQFDGCTHSGVVKYSALASSATGDKTEAVRMGGFCGYRGAAVTTKYKDCANTGSVILEGEQTAKGKSMHGYNIGGFFGRNAGNKLSFENCTNGELGSTTKGAVTAAGTPSSGITLGGIMGLTSHHFTATGCKNYGPIKQTGAGGASATYRSSIGGILGAAPNEGTSTITITNCENYGNVAYGSVTPTHRVDVGGIMGTSSQKGTTTITGCKNGGKIEYNASGAGVEISFGGIGGTIQRGTLTNCVNLATGEIYSNGTSSTNYNVAGITGSTALNSANLYNCDNYGHINQVKASKGTTQIGGINGYAYRFGTIDGCDNFGTITFAGTGTTKNGNVGGVIGHARFQGANAAADGSTPAGVAAVTNCGNYADQTWGGIAQKYYAGGVIGYCRSRESGIATLENLKNIANITFTSKGDSDANTYLGGICGTFGSADNPHHLDGGVFYGNCKAIGLEGLTGLAFGNIRTDTRFVENVQFGGNMVFAEEKSSVEDAGGEVIEEIIDVLTPITAENLYMYAYKYNGENPSATTEQLAADNCTVITTKPAVPGQN
ncbi:MAG: hypothetical protein IKB90_07820 [Alistipes sp.]|nr:hypothetical protein [Alistipes sp.]